jgi:hypothetical protein
MTTLPLVWKRKVTASGRSWWVLGLSAPRASGTGCGSWPTKEEAYKKFGEDVIAGMVKNWPTSRATDYKQGGWHNGDRTNSLPGAAKTIWPTPRSGKVTDETEEAWRERQEAGGVSTPPLTLAVKMDWATPTVNQVSGGPNNNAPTVKAGRHGINLHGQVQEVTQVAKARPSPKSRDWKGQSQRGQFQPEDALPNMVCHAAGPPAPENPSTDGSRPGQWGTPRSQMGGNKTDTGKSRLEEQAMAGQQLNPYWVATLMGYPPDWCHLPAETLSRLMATASSRRSSVK